MRSCSICGKTSVGPRCPKHAKRKAYNTKLYRQSRALTLLEETVCWICGAGPQPGDPLTADHLVEVTAGGTDLRSNMRAAHRSCNSRRGQQHQEAS